MKKCERLMVSKSRLFAVYLFAGAVQDSGRRSKSNYPME